VRGSAGGKHLLWEDGAYRHAGSGLGRKSLEANLIEHTSRAETVEQQQFANVWDALSDSPDEAANMTMRSKLIIAIQRKVAGWKVTQAEAARRLRITQPPLNDLLRSKIDKFSLDMLITLAGHAGITVRLEIAA
jgi:predicted XRE-type DNA-binding protein